MTYLYFVSIFALSTCGGLFATGVVLKYLHKKAILDHPNERSSHSTPTPRGGGIAIVAIALSAMAIVATIFKNNELILWPVIFSTLLLASLSWVDDLRSLGPGIRFLTQTCAVGLTLFFMPAPEFGYLGGFLPIAIEKILLGLAWVWFINLFNFMDGIDGISGVEIITITLGVVIVSTLYTLSPQLQFISLALGGASLGFLKWNWHKAKIFMGDVGSIPIGYLLGWMLIHLAGEGFVFVALILPLYHLSDATITLLKRAFRKEKIWQAHREHFYQQATQAGIAHNRVVLSITALNIALLGLALYSITNGLVAFFLGLLATFSLLYFFATRKKQ
ncbi:glycosyltransferase family 4 protein [Terasakiella sp. SH-1]|uniref:MraY family glycosyltransferase n=1 Tax=Terasakiella sp. SH-1 TaxID=2560057 RepID=UPI001073C5F7|nr:glycosyltransferase family 4 protein [Terasakiella sp. SH-1]